MSTYNNITLTGETPEARAWLDGKNIDKLPDFTGYDEPSWDRYDAGLDCVRIEGTWDSKYETDGVGAWVARITRKHPGIRAEWSQEWDTRDADEPGHTIDVWRRGEWEPAESRTAGLVPAKLDELLAAVKTTAVAHENAATQDSGDTEHHAAVNLRYAALALAEALEGATR
ncbi:MAG: hypothetical protein QM598_05605 [Protaetiibacter sp.]